MEKSLNSSRNFKLPPIQGAAPAANILRQPASRGKQTWPHEYGHRANGHHRSTRQVIHVPNDPFPGRYRSPRHASHNLSNAAGKQRPFNSGAVENEMNRGESLTLEFAPMVHNFPQSYTVLPPIQKISKPSTNETEIATQDKNLRGDEEKKLGAQLIRDDVGKPNNKHKGSGVQKHHDKSGDSNTSDNNIKPDSGNGRNLSKSKRQTDPENQDSETAERKQSATTVLFLKGKRIGRRVGVCLENEPALINVTEQLKEIFLRRNMEEMYLI